MKISIIGDGGWGTTLALLLNKKRYNVTIWGVFADYITYLSKTRVNIKFLPGVKIPKDIGITADLEEALDATDLILLAVPSQHMRSVVQKLKKTNPRLKAPFLSAAKGIEAVTLRRMSEVIREVYGKTDTAVLSGPTISHEVSRGFPTAVVVASRNSALAKRIQKIFISETFRIYTSGDVVGVELGGALKNVIAIAAGVLDGFGFEANTKAGLLTRGLAEISRLGVAMGARRDTFYGTSGLGDLVTTCISKYGRNRWFGEEIGKGRKPKYILSRTEMVVEGVATTKAAYQLSKKYKVEMPIVEQVYNVLYKGKSPKKAITDLMTRSPKAEM